MLQNEVEYLYIQNFKKLLRFALRFTKNSDKATTAEDLLHDAILSILENENLAYINIAYIFKTINSKSIDQYRKLARKNQTIEEITDSEPLFTEIEIDESRLLIEGLLKKLKADRDLETLTLLLSEEYSNEEIAQIMTGGELRKVQILKQKLRRRLK